MDKKFNPLIFAGYWGGALLIAVGIGATLGWPSGLIAFGIALLAVSLASTWIMEIAEKEKQSQRLGRTDIWVTKSVEKEKVQDE